MEENKRLKSNIWKFYILKALNGMFFSVPVIVLFWQDNGLSLTEVMFLQSFFAITIALLEIPTGYFADIFGRKKTLLIGSIALTTGMSIYSIGQNFTHFLFAEAFFAIGASLYSGTTSAFVYDTLKDLGKEENYKKIWGNAMYYGLITLALSNILGGFIAKIDLRLTLAASVPFFALLIPLVISMKEPKRHKFIYKKGYTKEIITIIKSTIAGNTKLKWLIIYSGVIYGFNQAGLWLYQPYFKLTGLDIIYYGFVFASFHIVAGITSKYAYKLEKKLGEKFSLAMLIFLIAGSYLLMSNFIFLFSFSFVYIFQFIRGFYAPVITDYINKLIDSNIRATILSIENFVGKLIYALIIPFIGWIADVYTIPQAFFMMFVTTLFFGVIMLIILKKEKMI